MNYIREAENVLKHYKDLYQSIENMDRQIGRLVSNAGPSGGRAIKLDESGIRSGKFDATINLLYEIQTLTDNKFKTQTELDEINVILDEISAEPGCEQHKAVLWKWYIERVPKEDIAEQIGYGSKQSVYNIRNLAIRKFAIRLFGIDALRAV